MKAHSKSKTFPKGTDPQELIRWVGDRIGRVDKKEYSNPDWSTPVTDSKYLITITRYTSKEETND